MTIVPARSPDWTRGAGRAAPARPECDGALLEMFEGNVCGELFPSGDVAALRAIIDRLVEAPEIIDRWRERLPRPKSVAGHAEEIEDVSEILRSRRR